MCFDMLNLSDTFFAREPLQVITRDEIFSLKTLQDFSYRDKWCRFLKFYSDFLW